MASNNYQWCLDRRTLRKVAGIHEVDALTNLTAQVAALTKAMQSVNIQNNSTYELCGGNYLSEKCSSNAKSVQYVANFNRQQGNPYSNTYNPGWRNHLNFSWNNNASGFQGGAAIRPDIWPPGFQNSQPQEKKSSIDDMFLILQNQNALIRSQATSIQNFET